MPCQIPNNNDISPRFKKWGAQLAKHSAFFSVRSLLFLTALFVLSGYAMVSWLHGQPDPRMKEMAPVIEMCNMGLIAIAGYFLVMEYLFRSRPMEIRLIQRFIWYCAILFMVSSMGLMAIFSA